MSTFLGFESYLIPLGDLPADVHNVIKTALSSRGWQVLQDNSAVTPTTLDVIPPASETIGGNGAYEFLRIKVGTDYIQFWPMKKWTVGFAQQVYIKELTAGAVTCSVTLDGQTVSYTGVSTNTAVQNLIGLYAAIRSSSNPTFTGWNWDVSFPAPQNANDPATYIFGINQTAQANKTISGVNVTAGILGNYVAPGFSTDETTSAAATTLTTDLVNGFIYYLQVNSRGIALATKTNGGFYGPAHACWANHAAALAYMPVDNTFITPVELVVGADNAATAEDGVGKTSSSWIISPAPSALIDYLSNYNTAPPNRGIRRYRFTDVIANNYTFGFNQTSNPLNQITLFGSGIFSGDNGLGNDFQVHRLKVIGESAGDMGSFPNTNSAYYSNWVRPGFEIEDWYKFRGTATNEALALIADTVNVTTLASNYTPGDTVVNLTDASLFQTSGFIIIGTEAIQYTGVTGNQLTGVTGSRYATLPFPHFTGDTVSQGIWFVVINGGAILAGYNKPV